MTIIPLSAWPTYFPRVRRRRFAERTWAGRRTISIEEQLELRRRRKAGETVDALAAAYGISRRTVFRYFARTGVLPTVEERVLRGRLWEWGRERNLRLTHDDLATLAELVTLHFRGGAA